MPTLTPNITVRKNARTEPPRGGWIDRELNQALALRALATLRSALRLTHAQIAMMLSRETNPNTPIDESTVHAWETRLTPIPENLANQLLADELHCLAILDLYRPERLPEVLRRPARLLNNETALSWILSGRIGDVATAYDRALRFQG